MKLSSILVIYSPQDKSANKSFIYMNFLSFTTLAQKQLLNINLSVKHCASCFVNNPSNSASIISPFWQVGMLWLSNQLKFSTS